MREGDEQTWREKNIERQKKGMREHEKDRTLKRETYNREKRESEINQEIER